MERTQPTAQKLPHRLCGGRSRYFSRADSSQSTRVASTCQECLLFAAISYSEDMTRFIFATESYGGHYGPSFVTYFEEQNALIVSGAIEGEPMVVCALMINK